jgi:hypothetical protein
MFALSILIPLISQVPEPEHGPAERPRYRLVVITHVGKLDSDISCSATNFQPDGTLLPSGGPLRCGQQGGRVCEVKWDFLRRQGDADIYQLTLSGSYMTPNRRTVEFTGKPVIVWEDQFFLVGVQGPKK